MKKTSKILILITLGLSFENSFSKSDTLNGCAVQGDLTSLGEMYGGSGNSYIDNITISELEFLSTSFGVRPAFYFYNDEEDSNAFSTPDCPKEYSADGTVCFGRKLFEEQVKLSRGGTNIPIILAHEFAHTVARRFDLHLPTRQNELFADYLAGGYMYYRSIHFKTVDIVAAAEGFYHMGDNDFTDPSHHGTPDSRKRCLLRGYMDCYNANQQGHLFTLNEGVNIGLDFVTTNDLK